jgi:hypothetical protein
MQIVNQIATQTNYLAVLWLGGRSCFTVLLVPDFVHRCRLSRGSRETVYDLCGWSLSPLFWTSSDTARYGHHGWQVARSQWCTGARRTIFCSALGSMPSSFHTKWCCCQSRWSQWCICRHFWRPEDPCQIFSASWGEKGFVMPSSWLCWCVWKMIDP